MKCFLFTVLLVFGLNLSAQHVEVRKKTNIREVPRAGADEATGGRTEAGERLILLDSSKQTRGFYHVQKRTNGVKGWIYRSMLKYHPEDIEFKGVEVTVIDVGAGLSCLIKLPDNKWFIYDAGRGYNAWRYITGIIDSGATINKLFLSHTDADHWGSVAKLAETYQIKEATYTSFRTKSRPIPTYTADGIVALQEERMQGLILRDLANDSITPGKVLYDSDEVKLTFVSGFGKPPKDWHLSDSHMNNAVSLVLRLDYFDKSILFTGDAVGLEDCVGDCNCPTECVATERFMLDSASHLLDVDVLIAAHHGAYNANCSEFIEAVSPEQVVFSAGNMYRHPRELTVDRFIEFGLSEEQIFRTDRGKKQKDGSKSCSDEWDGWNSFVGGEDGSGDDHIKIQLTDDGRVLIGYLD
ncbi:MAG: MBL fold metallo-hydrolase [Cytophagales bacterium]|nr:MBL fold metallo-hydrolase [Cytophagales bacterium]